jgi:hypothetical protein
VPDGRAARHLRDIILEVTANGYHSRAYTEDGKALVNGNSMVQDQKSTVV